MPLPTMAKWHRTANTNPRSRERSAPLLKKEQSSNHRQPTAIHPAPSLEGSGRLYALLAQIIGRYSDSWTRGPLDPFAYLPSLPSSLRSQCFVTAFVPTHRCGAVPVFYRTSLLRSRLLERAKRETDVRATIPDSRRRVNP